MRCAMTGRNYPRFSDGIWDDGEWISWEWINGQLREQEIRSKYADSEVGDLFEELVAVAAEYKELTGRYLQVWGELGELYAQARLGLELHSPHTQGSDGRLGNDFIEVKTISPEKSKTSVSVKRAGNFNKLLVVKINDRFEFEARMVERNVLKRGREGIATVSWSSMPKGLDENDA